MVKHINLNSQEVKALKRYAIERKFSTEEALIELLKEILSQHENIQKIIQKYSSKNRQIVLAVELWEDMEWQESTKIKKVLLRSNLSKNYE